MQKHERLVNIILYNPSVFALYAEYAHKLQRVANIFLTLSS